MNIIELSAPSLNALRPASRDVPRPGSGEVLVRLRAASLNFLDIAVASGTYPGPTFPMVPVADGAGEVAELGDGVGHWVVGDRVMPHFLPDWQDGLLTPSTFDARRGVTRPGSLAEYVAVPAVSLVATPDHPSFAEAATLPVAATTAWRAMRSAAIGPHSTVLLPGTGPVAALRAASAAIAAHRLVPVIDRVFEMRDAAAAYAQLAGGRSHFGKIALDIGK